MKKIVIVAAVVLIGAVLFRLFSPKESSTGTPGFGGRGGGGSRGPVAVQTTQVRFGPIQQKKEFTGTVKAAYTYIIAAKVSGRLIDLKKRIGDTVTKNEVVGQLEDTEYKLAVQEADAQLRVSNASLAEAQTQKIHVEREAERIRGLVNKGISSQAELDALATQLAAQASRVDLAQATTAQREAAREQSRTRLSYTSLRAFKSGFIAMRHMDGGALLSVNSPVLTVVGIDTVFVEIPITERDYPSISPGQNAQLMVEALPGRVFTGKVRGSAPSFQTATRTATIEIAFANDSLLLKPGMFANITLTLSSNESAQLIPFPALVSRNQTTVVFLIDGQKAKLVPVKTGIIENNMVEIVEPRLQGNVVTLGQHLLTDGSQVIIEGGRNDESREETKKRERMGDSKGARQ